MIIVTRDYLSSVYDKYEIEIADDGFGGSVMGLDEDAFIKAVEEIMREKVEAVDSDI